MHSVSLEEARSLYGTAEDVPFLDGAFFRNLTGPCKTNLRTREQPCSEICFTKEIGLLLRRFSGLIRDIFGGFLGLGFRIGLG
jgi:hypothetical protein